MYVVWVNCKNNPFFRHLLVICLKQKKVVRINLYKGVNISKCIDEETRMTMSDFLLLKITNFMKKKLRKTLFEPKTIFYSIG